MQVYRNYSNKVKCREQEGQFVFALMIFPHIFINFSHSNSSDEGLTLETSAFSPFTVANLRFQLSC